MVWRDDVVQMPLLLQRQQGALPTSRVVPCGDELLTVVLYALCVHETSDPVT